MIGAKERSNPWYLRTSSPSLINPYSQEVLELPQRQTSSAVYKLGVCVHPFRQNPPLPASTEIILGPAHSVWKHLQTAWSCQRTLLKQLGWGSPVCECSKAKGLQVSAPSCTIKLDGMIWYVYCMSTPGKKTWKQSAWRLADCKFKSSFTKQYNGERFSASWNSAIVYCKIKFVKC